MRDGPLRVSAQSKNPAPGRGRWHTWGMGTWREVAIDDCGEPLELVQGPRLEPCSAYWPRYAPALERVWARAGVVAALRGAAQTLPHDLTLVVWDGWRPLQLQDALWVEYRAAIAAASGLTGADLDARTRRFVSAPDADPLSPPPHLTGGSVDVTLGDAHGRPLDMGGTFDELGPRSATSFYEREPEGVHQRLMRDRRRLLCAVMTRAGFSNYPEEWFHFDLGNQFHHFRVGGTARYGRVLTAPAT